MESQRLVDWLLATPEPALRWRTFTELLDRPADNSEVLQARSAIPDSPTVKALLASMHPDGYWRVKHYRTKEWIGAGVRYADFSTTHFVLSYLAELGLGGGGSEAANDTPSLVPAGAGKLELPELGFVRSRLAELGLGPSPATGFDQGQWTAPNPRLVLPMNRWHGRRSVI